jgi:hypothetical protein
MTPIANRSAISIGGVPRCGTSDRRPYTGRGIAHGGDLFSDARVSCEGRLDPHSPVMAPPPWHVIEMAGCFIVQDATGQNVALFHFRDDATVSPLFKERVRRRAVNFAGPLLDKADRD